MKKSNLLMVCVLLAIAACSLAMTSCKATRTISATGYTVSTHRESGADSVRCGFVLNESYVGVQKKQ